MKRTEKFIALIQAVVIMTVSTFLPINNVWAREAYTESKENGVFCDEIISPAATEVKDDISYRETAASVKDDIPDKAEKDKISEKKQTAETNKTDEVLLYRSLPADIKGKRPDEDISLCLSGNMPRDGKVLITPVENMEDIADNVLDNANGESILHIYDISIVDESGEDFQPKDGEPITVSIKSDAVEAAIAEGKELSVIHIMDDGTCEEVNIISAENGELKFAAQGFSIYVIKEHETSGLVTPRVTYHFLSYIYTPTETAGQYLASEYMFTNEAGDRVSTQIIKNGDALQPIPTPPNTSAGYFYGWYTVELISEGDGDYIYKWQDSPEKVALETPIIVNATEDEDVYLAPLYSNYRFVSFHESEKTDSNGKDILTRKLVALGDDNTEDIYISDIAALPPDAYRIIFWGWKTEDGPEINTVNERGEPIPRYITVTDQSRDVHLYPVFKQARWLNFVSGESGSGAQYIASRFVMLGSGISELDVSTRNGYRFMGWYTGSTDSGGSITYSTQVTDSSGNVVSANNMLDSYGSKTENGELILEEALTLYAKWETEATADYTVIIWQQKITDTKGSSDRHYDYYDSMVFNGNTGSNAIQDDDFVNGGFNGYANNADFKGFEFFKYDPSPAIIKTDGSTVVNVYYNRKLMTIRFNRNSGTVYLYYKTDSTNGTLYGYAEGSYRRIYYGAVTTTYKYNGESYSGTTYALSSSTSPTTQYVVRDGTVAPVYYSNIRGRWYYTKTGLLYSDPVPDGTQRYTEATTGTLYGFIGGEMRLLESVTDNCWYYQNNSANIAYNGSRYTRSTMGNTLEWTGLYGQTFEQNGYSWDTVAGYIWKENGTNTTQTMLHAFTQETTPYILTRSDELSNPNFIYHLVQNEDGSYSRDSVYTARTKSSNGTFNFSNKFDGFTVCAYSTVFSPSDSGAGVTSVAPGNSAQVNYPIYVYHKRNTYDFVFNYNYSDAPRNLIYKDVPYGSPLRQYEVRTEDPVRPHYVFLGWFEDKSATERFDFSQGMPANNKIIYAGWQPEYYLIQIDPNGGQMGTTGSTYFWLPYNKTIEEYKDVIRSYIRDDSGEYKYVNIKFFGENDGYGLNAGLRKSFYIRASEVNTYYNTHYADTGDPKTYMTYENFMSCVSSENYRPLVGDEAFSLLGWYRINNENGAEIEDKNPYSFSTPVTQPVKLKAKWKYLNQHYSFAYDPIETYNGVLVSAVNATMPQRIDPDPNDPDAEKYADQANAITLPAPTMDVLSAEDYDFRGWRIVDENGAPMQQGVYYNSGDIIKVESQYADSQGIIHMMAHYELKSESTLRPQVTLLILDANGGEVNGNGLPPGSTYVYADEEQDELYLAKQADNIEVRLKNYINNIVHPDSYLLLGWNKTPQSGDYIPQYYADAIIGIDRIDRDNNKLYALWEPMVYLTVVNNSSQSRTFTLDVLNADGTTYTGETLYINQYISLYDRRRYNIDYPITLLAGETMKLVFPNGSGLKYRVSGVYAGNKELFYVDNSGAEDGIYTSIYTSGERYTAEGYLITDPVGRIVNFRDENIFLPPPTDASTQSIPYTLMLVLAGAMLTAGRVNIKRNKNKKNLRSPKDKEGSL